LKNRILAFFYRLSKRFSRVNLYEWLQVELASHNGRAASAGKKASVLNVGSGGDVYGALKKNPAFHITQIDIDPARKPDIVADICDLNMFQEHSCDIVVMLEVLEHVKEPQRALDEIRRVLKPGGTLILSVPFIFPIHDEPYDFYRYTKYGLQYLLRDYRDISMRERNDYIHALIVLFSRMTRVTDKKSLMAGLIIFSYILIQYPFFWVMSKFFQVKLATTGYFVTAKT
jgi:ubiquinone/menaquinone biosynthesis C-methylase UbiE